jgi:hypothetical protein
MKNFKFLLVILFAVFSFVASATTRNLSVSNRALSAKSILLPVDSATVTLYHGGMSFDNFRIKLNSNDDPTYAVDYYFYPGSPVTFKVPGGNYTVTLEADLLDFYYRATPNWSTPDGVEYGSDVYIDNMYLDGNVSFIGYADYYVPNP